LDQQLDGPVGDPILGVIQVKVRRLRRQALAACRVIGEQFPQMQLLQFLVMGAEGLPGRALGQLFDWGGRPHDSLI